MAENPLQQTGGQVKNLFPFTRPETVDLMMRYALIVRDFENQNERFADESELMALAGHTYDIAWDHKDGKQAPLIHVPGKR